MMKLKATLIALGSALLLTACGDDNGDYHYLDIPGSSVTFADQERDTINIISTDSWTATEDADWMELAFTTHKPSGTAGTSSAVPIAQQPNLTGKARGTYVRVTSNGKHLNKSKVQVYWMNIVLPQPTYVDDSHHTGKWLMGDDLDNLKVNFEIIDSATTERDSVCFYLYDSRATLTTTADWVTITEGEFTRPTGDRVRLKKAFFTMTPNTTGADRTTTLTLRAGNGASTEVKLTQRKMR